MRKGEFLEELEHKLKGLPRKDIDNRISFYNEMLNDLMDDGLTEEEAINHLGSVDSIIEEIAEETSLAKLVKEKVRPKRKLKTWEIILIILGFPIWLPLLLTAFILALVAYLLIWVLVIVVYTVETALVVGSVGAFIAFFIYLFNGEFNLLCLGASILAAGASILLFFVAKIVTKLTIKLSKKILTKIKTAFIKKGSK